MPRQETCDVCGTDVFELVKIGATILCPACRPLVEKEMAAVEAAGKPVSAARIAAGIRRKTLHAYILRDIPPELWERVQAEAARRDQTARDFIMSAIKRALS